MKLLIFCVIVIANISSNGKASLNNNTSTSAPVLFYDNTKKIDKSCYRPCKWNDRPRQCVFRFKIEPTISSTGTPAITINRKIPGPPIHVCLNDFVTVEVINKLPDQDLTIHWHGMEQKGTPFMDGVPMVTQCPISYGSKYRYAFIASIPGTHFYHADSVSHQSDGVYGAFIVNQPQSFEPHHSLYDYDRSKEQTIIIAAKFQGLMTGNFNDIVLVEPTTLIIHEEENFKLPGFAYRLRFINAIAIECPVFLSIDNHELTVIATDGRLVKPMSANNVLLYPGERMDVVVRASDEIGGYWLRARGSGICTGLQASTMFLYTGLNYSHVFKEQSSIPVNSMTIFGQKLQSYNDQEIPNNSSVKKYYLGIDERILKFNETEIDFKYTMDSSPSRPFYPASLTFRDTGVIQINNKSFLYPSTPILLTISDPDDLTCEIGKESTVLDPQCLQILPAKIGDIVELALVNEGSGGAGSFTFHMHGYGMQVVATSRNELDQPMTKDDFLYYDAMGKIKRNLRNPPIKDTITVHNKGYTIVRMQLNRGGSWLLECRSCGLLSLPTAIIIRIPQILPKSILDALPRCGNFKPRDVLLN